MPRHCLICNQVQRLNFSVFSIPTQPDKRALWIAAIKEIQPNFTPVKVSNNQANLRNGICERHFYPDDITRGKKCRLSARAVPRIIDNFENDNSDQIDSRAKMLDHLEDEKEYLDESLYYNDDDIVKNLLFNESKGLYLNGERKAQTSQESFIEKHIVSNGLFSSEFKDTTVNFLTYTESSSAKEDFIGFCIICSDKSSENKFLNIEKSQLYNGLLISQALVKILNKSKGIIMKYGNHVCTLCLDLANKIYKLREELLCHEESFKNTYKNSAIYFRENDEKGLFQTETNAIKNDQYSNSSQAYNCSRKSLRLSLNQNSIPCSKCKKSFSSHTTLHDHLLNKHDVNPFEESEENASCIDEKSFTDANSKISENCENEVKEIPSNSSKKGFECLICRRILNSKAWLQAHMFKFHNIGKAKSKTEKCLQCGKQFSSKAGLSYHKNVYHQEGTTYVCKFCDKVFYHHVPYKSHVLFAHGEKKINCDMCGAMFFTVAKLNIHVNAVHRNAESWSCIECNLKFKTNTSFSHHNSIKHKPIRHKCSHCESDFRKKSSLIYHMLKHSIFICHICNNVGDDWNKYVEHMQQIHNQDVNWKMKKLKNKNKNKMVVKVPVSKVDFSECSNVDKDSSIIINDFVMSSSICENNNLSRFSNLRDIDSCNVEEIFDSVEGLSNSDDQLPISQNIPLLNVHMLDNMDIETNNSLDFKGDIMDEKINKISKTNPVSLSDDHLSTHLRNNITIEMREEHSLSLEQPLKSDVNLDMAHLPSEDTLSITKIQSNSNSSNDVSCSDSLSLPCLPSDISTSNQICIPGMINSLTSSISIPIHSHIDLVVDDELDPTNMELKNSCNEITLNSSSSLAIGSTDPDACNQSTNNAIESMPLEPFPIDLDSKDIDCQYIYVNNEDN